MPGTQVVPGIRHFLPLDPMLLYLLRRLAFLAVSLVVAMVVIFVLLRLLPGDPANALLSIDATPEQIAAARAQVGSDQPLIQQFATWAGQLLRFDLGDSYISSRAVGPEIAARLVVTLPLTLLAFGLALVVSLVVGITAAVKADRWYGIVLSGFAQLGVAVPVFWVGVILVWIFALQLGLLPSGGFPRDDWEDPADALRSLALPVVAIAIVMSASLSRYVRSATLSATGCGTAPCPSSRCSASNCRPPCSARSWSRASSHCPASAACCSPPSSSTTTRTSRACWWSAPCSCCSSASPLTSCSA
ncbi:MAG: gsiC 1 [Microbacterium sp.]|nr:gsiC 1 [Microbacterium sp.]